MPDHTLKSSEGKEPWITTTYHKASAWGMRIAYILIILVLIFSHLHIEEKPSIELGLLVTLMLIMSESIAAGQRNIIIEMVSHDKRLTRNDSATKAKSSRFNELHRPQPRAGRNAM
jgi:hypothetical protein